MKTSTDHRDHDLVLGSVFVHICIISIIYFSIISMLSVPKNMDLGPIVFSCPTPLQVWSRRMTNAPRPLGSMLVAEGRVFFVDSTGLLWSISSSVRPDCLPWGESTLPSHYKTAEHGIML